MTKLEEAARALCKLDGYDPDSDPNDAGNPLWTEVAFPPHWRKWSTYVRRVVVVLRAIRTPDMEMARRIAAETGLPAAHVDLAWTRMIDSLSEEGK